MNRLAKSVPKKNGQRKTLSIQKLKLVQRYFDLAKLYLEGNQKKNLLMDVKAFEVASLAGNYYQSFAVNSKNYQGKSGGTRTWIAECDRLLDRCVAQAIKGNAAYAQQILTALSLPLKLLFFALVYSLLNRENCDPEVSYRIALRVDCFCRIVREKPLFGVNS